MKVRAREATYDFSTAMGASAQASRSMSFFGYGRQAGGGELRKDSRVTRIRWRLPSMSKSLSEAVYVFLRCLSAVSGVAERYC